MDILQQDRRESAEQRQELCDIITRLQGDLQSTEEQRDKVGLLQKSFSTFVLFYLMVRVCAFFFGQLCSWRRSVSSSS